MENKYWAVHGGSDSHFAATDANDAWDLVKMFNSIALKYDLPPTSKVVIVESKDLAKHDYELCKRLPRALKGE